MPMPSTCQVQPEILSTPTHGDPPQSNRFGNAQMTAVTHSHIVDDAELVRAARRDRHAFAAIYERYADRLYAYCLGQLADRDAAADCVQETFYEAARDLATLRNPANLRPWLYGIARHQVIRCVRQNRREEVRDRLPDQISGESGPSTVIRRRELAAYGSIIMTPNNSPAPRPYTTEATRLRPSE